MTNLGKILNKKEKYIVGLISGTSMDGVDAVLIKLKGCAEKTSFKQIGFITYPYPPGLKERIIEIISNKKVSLDEISRINFLIGEIFGEAALKVCQKSGVAISEIDLIGSHGQTIWHSPVKEEMFGHKIGATLQLGDPSTIAVKTGIPTVGDFRTADVSSGGEGAPLIPYFDYLMFRDKSENRAILNIGGISNVTLLPKNCKKKDVIGFDCGPGNLLIDQIAKLLFQKDFDKNGNIAIKGKLSVELLNFMKEHPFLMKKPPKSSGREEFGNNYIKKILKFSEKLKKEDIIKTITEFTAFAIYLNFQRFIKDRLKVDRLIISGGGAKNKLVMNSIKKYFKETKIESTERYGIFPDAKEAIAFAVYANETISGNPISIKNVTGANRENILGKICLISF